MRIQFPLYTYIAIVVCMVMVWMIMSLHRAAEQRQAVGAREHAYTSALVLCWFIAYVCELASTNQGVAVLFLHLQYLAYMFIPTTWIAFVGALRGKPVKFSHLVLVSLPAVSTALLVLLVPVEWGATHTNIAMTDTAPYMLSYDYSPVYIVSVLYMVLTTLVGIALMLWHVRHARKRQRQRIIFFVISLTIPTCFAFINIFWLQGSGNALRFDMGSSISVLAAIGISWALLRVEVFELLPIARDVVMENLREGVLVLDTNKHVIDSNTAAHYLLGMEQNALMTELRTPEVVEKLLAPLQEKRRRADGKFRITQEQRYQLELNARHFDITVSPFYQRNRYRAMLILLRDISEEVTARYQLQQAYHRINTLNTQLEQENQRLSTELEVARKIQDLVLPEQHYLDHIQQEQNLEIAVAMTPAHEVSGDYYDVLGVDDGVIFAIGDVTGHGLESGIVMLMVQSDLRILLNHGERDLRKILYSLNTSLYENLHSHNHRNFDKTFSLSLLHYDGQGTCSVSGQHEDIVILRADGKVECMDTLALGFPIGLEKDISYLVNQEQFTLNAGDSLVLFTDGITEAENDGGQRYEIEQLLECIRQLAGSSAEAIKDGIMNDVQRHCGTQKFLDDVTLMVIQALDSSH